MSKKSKYESKVSDATKEARAQRIADHRKPVGNNPYGDRMEDGNPGDAAKKPAALKLRCESPASLDGDKEKPAKVDKD
jgi:hypothetical protein